MRGSGQGRMMDFIVMAIYTTVCAVIFFLSDDYTITAAAGMTTSAIASATIVWGLVYFEII